MVQRDDLVRRLDEVLMPESGPVEDVSNNGLQVEGHSEVNLIVFGVDACQALFEEAADMSADMIFVHHGLSWGGGIKKCTGVTAERFKTLFDNTISLYASHLPLDMHPELGHNIRIAQKLGVVSPVPFFEYGGVKIGFGGALNETSRVGQIADSLDHWLETESHVLGRRDKVVESVGIVSGDGADAVGDCADAGYDCLITGEMKHSQYHMALERHVSVIAAGHYCTETPGVSAVMDWVRRQFPIECCFVRLPTGL